MKILFLSITMISVFHLKAQNKNSDSFNRWSIEFNVGQNKAVKPFSPKYYTSNPSKYFNVNGFEHFDLGTRYMFSTSFGLKFDIAYDVLKNNDKSSLPFKNEQYRIGLQGVVNLGKMLQFETFTNRLGLLSHAGFQVSTFNPKLGSNAGHSEQNGGIIFGFTPQFKITNRIAVTADFSVIGNVRQHLNWDGSYATSDNNLTGLMYNTSIGITTYLGNYGKHDDRNSKLSSSKKNKIAQSDQDKFIDKQLDMDKDGIPDYKDLEKNSALGVAVDPMGRAIVENSIYENGSQNIDFSSLSETEKDFYNLLRNNYNVFYYDLNRIDPNKISRENLVHILAFLKKYPDAKVKLIGYADARGGNSFNDL